MRQRALITGASSGIGLELAREFARHGIDPVLVARNEEPLRLLAKELTERHKVLATVFATDLSLASNVNTLVEWLDGENLQIDYLVNNAGFGECGEFTKTSWDKEHTMIELNITALTHLTKVFLPRMVSRGSGGILNVASVAAFQPGPMMAVYYATKAYVLSLTEALAEETAGTGVTLTCLCPGPTESNFARVANATSSRVFRKRLPSSQSVARFGYRALMRGQRIAIHGVGNFILAEAIRFAPRRLVTKIVKHLQSDAV
jgi:short-subunit dehydrogenase